MEHDTKQSIKPMSDNYGQFVTFNDNNEIMCYSRTGKPIYNNHNPPASPVKNKLSNTETNHIEDDYIPKYRNIIDPNSHKTYSIFGILYGIVASCTFLVIFISLYSLFFK